MSSFFLLRIPRKSYDPSDPYPESFLLRKQNDKASWSVDPIFLHPKNRFSPFGFPLLLMLFTMGFTIQKPYRNPSSWPQWQSIVKRLWLRRKVYGHLDPDNLLWYCEVREIFGTWMGWNVENGRFTMIFWSWKLLETCALELEWTGENGGFTLPLWKHG